MSSLPSFADLIRAVLDTLRAAGCQPHDEKIVAFDGVLHRYRIEGEKPGSQNGWLVLHGDGIPAGAFGSWRSGLSETWCAKRESELTDAEKAQRDASLADAKRQREADRRSMHLAAKGRAADLWAKARDTVDVQFPYLLKKQIPAIGICQLQSQLVVPMRDFNGVLHSLQFIGPDGEKIFLTGGSVEGHVCLLGEPDAAENC